MPDRRTKALREVERKVDWRTNQLRSRVAEWLRRLAEKHIADELRRLRTGRRRLAKADVTDKELLEILTTYGLRHTMHEGSGMADALGGEWRVEPQLVRSVISQKAVRVKRITRGAAKAVREKIREIMLKAEREVPQPSVAELSRRIRREVADLHIFSVQRAGLIARTESLQNQATGIYRGMQMAGVEEHEWLSSKNPDHGDRHHERMNGMVVKIGEMFTNPTTGRKLRYPGDPQAHISETANCGCTTAPKKKAKKAA